MDGKVSFDEDSLLDSSPNAAGYPPDKPRPRRERAGPSGTSPARRPSMGLRTLAQLSENADLTLENQCLAMQQVGNDAQFR